MSVNQTVQKLFENYPDAKCSLIYNTTWQLLLATILSAQTKDENVNKSTSVLFKEYSSLKAISKANQEDVQKIIYSTGFYRTKSKNIINAAKYIIENYKGEVPSKMEDLIKIPGVARKTANVVLTEGFKNSHGLAVDTHVKRISKRLGWTASSDPKQIEKDLMCKISKKYWQNLTNVLIAHGRSTCDAKKPKCKMCPVNSVCPFYTAISK